MTPRAVAERLNRECDCTLTDMSALRRRLSVDLRESHPHLFSEAPVFVDEGQADAMRDIVAAVEQLVRLPGYRQIALASAPPVAWPPQRASGVFCGFDFHLSPAGPKLIEINTNAGGAFLNTAARAAGRDCCPGAGRVVTPLPSGTTLEEGFFAMFQDEWRQARGDQPLRSVAIVDEDPARQYLYPEFELARAFFEARGIDAQVVDSQEVVRAGNEVQARGRRIDLIYNRLTDFYLEQPSNAGVRAAYEYDLAVVTPHPQAHALYASKANLAIFGDAQRLEALGLPASQIRTLVQGVPETRAVANGEPWWRDRKDWFFKPVDGFGSRGAYRGDKLTRRVFADIMDGGYVAQRLVPPSERWRTAGAVRAAFKLDVRCYAYAGEVQLMAARLYQGQTTNFRTAGGGFAPVYLVRA